MQASMWNYFSVLSNCESLSERSDVSSSKVYKEMMTDL